MSWWEIGLAVGTIVILICLMNRDSADLRARKREVRRKFDHWERIAREWPPPQEGHLRRRGADPEDTETGVNRNVEWVPKDKRD